MNIYKNIRVGFSSRILPEYRLPVYKELSSRNNIVFTAYFGKGTPNGAYTNAKEFLGIKCKKLFTIKIPLGRNVYRVWHPTLIVHLIKDNIDVIITEGTPNMFNNITSFIYAKTFNKKFITYEAGENRAKTVYRKLLFPVEFIINKYANAFITYNSSADRALLKAGIPKSKIFRSQNTIANNQSIKNLEEFKKIIEKQKQLISLENHFIINYTGGIEKRKKLEILLNAYRILYSKKYKVALFIVGDGPDYEYYKSMAKNLGLQKITFWGRRIDDVYKYFLLSDICVLPSQGGLLINDAMIYGKPIIATEEAVAGYDSVYDYIISGFNGYVIKKDSVADLADTLEKIICNYELYEKLCRGSLEYSKKFSISSMVDGIEDAINYVTK